MRSTNMRATPSTSTVRTESFGERWSPSLVDRFGVWLSARRLRAEVRSFRGLRIGDFGCGYNAMFARSVLDSVESAVLADVSLADDLQTHPRVDARTGTLPGVIETVPDRSLDVVMCMSVLEHLWDPELTLRHLHRVTKPGGVCVVNVPSWRGKRFLELSAFRLGLSPASEMDDHKWYFDPKDLWPLLVRAGFLPSGITCKRHKFGLNTIAVCRVPEA
jgi:SAM-dependent methyltransferase